MIIIPIIVLLIFILANSAPDTPTVRKSGINRRVEPDTYLDTTVGQWRRK